MRSFLWLVPTALAVVMAHGCLNPQPTAPARDDSAGSGGTSMTSGGDGQGEGANTTGSQSTFGSAATATSGAQHGSGGTAEPSPGAGGQAGAAGATGLDQGGAPDGE